MKKPAVEWALSLVVLLAVSPMVGCGPCKNSGSRILSDSASWSEYGEPMRGKGHGISFGLLVADTQKYDGTKMIVRDGRVISVDPVDGRWMVLREGTTSVRVTFEDPAHRFPADGAGGIAMMEGTYRAPASEEDEVGGSPEPSFVATGVRLSS